ncbi:alpha/beta hydrolase [Pelagibius marinus]|uniref:alpha/beta hydrolase n=1 Tax=Pelagibius marinus TaxID=2762760 RepID=UPI0018730675|nr:alpha/beta hydrolase [Pelagibius marinus]
MASEQSGGPVFRDYDQAALDRELNLRARWPDHPQFFERWARDSGAVRDRLTAHLDLAYGEDPAERLDLFPAEGGRNAPLLAFIHGGYWQALDKGDYSYMAPAFVETGVAFASLNYGLAPDCKIGEMIDQTRRALAWLHRHAGDYGVDPARIVVAGHSAGGHLAAMALSTDWPSFQAGLPAGLLAGGCSISGVYDLEPVRLSYHNKVLHIEAQETLSWSPLHCLPAADRPGGAPPLLLAVGSEETNEFLRQHAEYAAAWQARGLPLGEVDMTGLHHFTAVDALADRRHALYIAAQQLLHRGLP